MTSRQYSKQVGCIVVCMIPGVVGVVRLTFQFLLVVLQVERNKTCTVVYTEHCNGMLSESGSHWPTLH